jgi:hypothetical protein
MFNNFVFENLTIYEIMWKNIVEPNGPHMKTWLLPFASCIPKATNTHSKYVIIIVFPLQQWFHERASVLRYTYVACLITRNFYWARSTDG